MDTSYDNFKNFFKGGRHSHISVILEPQRAIKLPFTDYCNSCNGYCTSLDGKLCKGCGGTGLVDSVLK